MHICFLQLQQLLLSLDAACIAGQASVRSHYPVAGNENRDRIVPDRPADSLRGQVREPALRGQLLLERARDLLLSTDQPVESVSDELGFSSASYFRKKFKAHFGMTPGEMRKKYRI